jgi:predicted cupin superfamily sugar epimerase
VIYFMLLAPDFSALHALGSAETYHWYAGSALRMLLLHPGGRIEQPVLGPDLGGWCLSRGGPSLVLGCGRMIR